MSGDSSDKERIVDLGGHVASRYWRVRETQPFTLA
jgi:hypothetical protein